MSKILIAEDDENLRKIIGITLQSTDIELIFAQDGINAVEAAKKELPDVIILDVMMPGKNGIQVTKELRAYELTGNIPIILVTACGKEEDINKGLEAGANEYFVKPFSPVQLLDRVYAFLAPEKG
jgi:DNA-binding response OmpR family regulator